MYQDIKYDYFKLDGDFEKKGKNVRITLIEKMQDELILHKNKKKIIT